MAEGTYEFECMRAELLGLEKPDKEQFELARQERLKAEQEQLATEESTDLDLQDEALGRTGGKLDELNSILSSTQQRLNRFKKTACGSLSNIFSKHSIDEPSTSKDHSENNKKPPEDINSALDTLEKIGDIEKMETGIQFAKNASLDIEKKMTSQLDKLDALVNKAENAELSMSAQNKEIRKHLKK